jgi:hypothetical protein
VVNEAQRLFRSSKAMKRLPTVRVLQAFSGTGVSITQRANLAEDTEKNGKCLYPLTKKPDPGRIFKSISKVLQLTNQFDIPGNLWNIQNAFLDACRDLPKEKAKMQNLYQDFTRQIEIPFEIIT